MVDHPRARLLSSGRAGVGLLATIAAVACGAPDHGPGRARSPNLAHGRPVALVGATGDPAVVTDGRLLTEGSLPVTSAVALPDVSSAVVVDLGAPRLVHALALQATAGDIYFVEASTDGAQWRIAWRVASVRSAPEMRTRTIVLGRPVPARWLRVRPTTTTAAAVSEVQAFGEGRPAFPTLDVSPPGSALPPWPALTRERLAALYEPLAALLLLAAGWSVLARRSPGGPSEERIRRGTLGALALASLAAWPYLFNFHYPGFVHTGELFHYYVGSKYLPELGYTRLYACTVVADSEDGVDLDDRLVRDLRDNLPAPARSQLARKGECLSAFSVERWEAFRRDVAFFRARLGPDKWFRARNDHGFNGTPAWAIVGGSVARLVPASEPGILFLALIDVVLLLAVFAIMARTFGLEATCVGAGFFGLNTLSEFGWTGGSFLRYDWLLWLVAGLAALRTGRSGIAGFALVSSSLLRIFPACALVGLGLKALYEVARARSTRVLWRHRRFAGGALVALVLFVPTSALRMGGFGVWGEFARNSAKHLQTQAANFVGLQVFLAHRHDARFEIMNDPLRPDRSAAWRAQLDAAYADTRPALGAAGVALLLLLALAVRTAPDWAAAVLGLGLMPMLKLSGYYYSGWIVYALLWSLAPAAAFALAVLGWATNVIPQLFGGADEQHAWLSLALSLFAVGLTGALAWRWNEPRGGGTDGRSETGAAGDAREPGSSPRSLRA